MRNQIFCNQMISSQIMQMQTTIGFAPGVLYRRPLNSFYIFDTDAMTLHIKVLRLLYELQKKIGKYKNKPTRNAKRSLNARLALF